MLILLVKEIFEKQNCPSIALFCHYVKCSYIWCAFNRHSFCCWVSQCFLSAHWTLIWLCNLSTRLNPKIFLAYTQRSSHFVLWIQLSYSCMRETNVPYPSKVCIRRHWVWTANQPRNWALAHCCTEMQGSPYKPHHAHCHPQGKGIAQVTSTLLPDSRQSAAMGEFDLEGSSAFWNNYHPEMQW